MGQIWNNNIPIENVNENGDAFFDRLQEYVPDTPGLSKSSIKHMRSSSDSKYRNVLKPISSDTEVKFIPFPQNGSPSLCPIITLERTESYHFMQEKKRNKDKESAIIFPTARLRDKSVELTDGDEIFIQHPKAEHILAESISDNHTTDSARDESEQTNFIESSLNESQSVILNTTVILKSDVVVCSDSNIPVNKRKIRFPKSFANKLVRKALRRHAVTRAHGDSTVAGEPEVLQSENSTVKYEGEIHIEKRDVKAREENEEENQPEKAEYTDTIIECVETKTEDIHLIPEENSVQVNEVKKSLFESNSHELTDHLGEPKMGISTSKIVCDEPPPAPARRMYEPPAGVVLPRPYVVKNTRSARQLQTSNTALMRPGNKDLDVVIQIRSQGAINSRQEYVDRFLRYEDEMRQYRPTPLPRCLKHLTPDPNETIHTRSLALQKRKEKKIKQFIENENKAREFHAKPMPNKTSSGKSLTNVISCPVMSKSLVVRIPGMSSTVEQDNTNVVPSNNSLKGAKRSLTASELYKLNMERHAKQKKMCEVNMKERQKQREERIKLMELEKFNKERQEYLNLRKQATNVANPIKHYKCPKILPSPRKPTIPIGPKLSNT